MLRTEQILNAKFTPISKGTYSADEVDAFLKTVAESYEESLNESRELIKKISILADKIESYRNDEEAIKLSLLDAHRMAETINKNAVEKSDTMLSEAESKSKIILDGANRQSSQMIDESREKAKEIVDNARTAVAALTERAQKETEQTIYAAQNKAEEMIAQAQAESDKIIGNSKRAYEYYSAELDKVKAETAKFKETIEEICKGQLSLLENIPAAVIAAVAAASAATQQEVPAFLQEDEAEEVVEQTFEEEAPVSEPEELPVEAEEEPRLVYVPDEANEEDELPAEFDEDEADEDEYDEIDDDEADDDEADDAADDESDDDLFSLIDNISFDDVALPDSIASSLDEIVPEVPAVQEDEGEDFGGFKIDLDAIDDIGEEESEDDDITSLFDSMFDE